MEHNSLKPSWEYCIHCVSNRLYISGVTVLWFLYWFLCVFLNCVFLNCDMTLLAEQAYITEQLEQKIVDAV